MGTLVFVAVGVADPSGGYRASFPDLDDSTFKGADLAMLIVAARQTLAATLQRLLDAGEAWPIPSAVEKVGLAPGAFPMLVDYAVDDPPIRVNISLGERLVQRLDAAAELRGMSRSGFIAQAVRVSLGERGSATEFDAAARTLQDELRTLGRKVNESIGPDSPFSRRMAELDDQVYEGVRKAADSVSAAIQRRRATSAEPPQSDGAGQAEPSEPFTAN